MGIFEESRFQRAKPVIFQPWAAVAGLPFGFIRASKPGFPILLVNRAADNDQGAHGEGRQEVRQDFVMPGGVFASKPRLVRGGKEDVVREPKGMGGGYRKSYPEAAQEPEIEQVP